MQPACPSVPLARNQSAQMPSQKALEILYDFDIWLQPGTNMLPQGHRFDLVRRRKS